MESWPEPPATPAADAPGDADAPEGIAPGVGAALALPVRTDPGWPSSCATAPPSAKVAITLTVMKTIATRSLVLDISFLPLTHPPPHAQTHVLLCDAK